MAARLATGLAIVWAIYLIAFFVLPQQWVHQPTLRALDVVLWPIARTLGKPAVVAIVAVAVAVLTLLIQRFATDNRRLLEAKRRATAHQETGRLPSQRFTKAGGPDASGRRGAGSHADGSRWCRSAFCSGRW